MRYSNSKYYALNPQSFELKVFQSSRMKKALQHLLDLVRPATDSSDERASAPTTVAQRRYAARSPAQLMGERGELIARQYLEQAGLRYVDSNVASTLGEIDLIMQEGAVLVFVEVKLRRSDAYNGAVATITPSKLARLRKAIALYLQQHPAQAQRDCRIDAVLIQGVGQNRHLEWLRNIDAC